MVPTDWTMQGAHRYARDADTVYFELHGLFSLADTKCLHELTQTLVAEYGYYLSVFDARDGINMTPEARRYAGEMTRQNTADGATLIVGAGMAMRVVTNLMRNAASLFGKEQPPVEFCSTMEEVPAWLAAQRKRLQR